MADAWIKDYYGRPMSDISQSAIETAKYLDAWGAEKQQRQNERAVSSILAEAKGDMDIADQMGIRQYLNPKQSMEWQTLVDTKRKEREQQAAVSSTAESLFPNVNVGPTVENQAMVARRGMFRNVPNIPEALQGPVLDQLFPEPVKPEQAGSPFLAVGKNVFNRETGQFVQPPEEAQQKPTEYKFETFDGKRWAVNPIDPADRMELGEIKEDPSGLYKESYDKYNKVTGKTELRVRFYDKQGNQVRDDFLGYSDEKPRQQGGGEDGASLTKGAQSNMTNEINALRDERRGLLNLKGIYDPVFSTYLARGENYIANLQKKLEKGEQLNAEERRFAQFDVQTRQLFNTYRKRITGAAAAMSELEFLEKSYLSGKMSAGQYEEALDLIIWNNRTQDTALYSQLQAGKLMSPTEYDDFVTKSADETVMQRYNISEALIEAKMKKDGLGRDAAKRALVNKAMEIRYGR